MRTPDTTRYPTCPPMNATAAAVRAMTERCVMAHVERRLRGVSTLAALELAFKDMRDDLTLVLPWLDEVKRYTLARNVALNTLDSTYAEYLSFNWTK